MKQRRKENAPHAQPAINLLKSISYWNMYATIQKKVVLLHFQHNIKLVT